MAANIRDETAHVSGEILREAEQARTALSAEGSQVVLGLSAAATALRLEAERARDQIAEITTGFGAEIADRVASSERDLSDSSDRVAERLAERTRALSQILADRNAELANLIETRDAADRRRAVPNRTAAIEALEGTSDQVAERLRAENAAVVADFIQRTEERVQRLSRSSSELISALDFGPKKRRTRVSSMQGQLGQEITQLLDRLDNSNETLRTMLEDASGSIGRVETSLIDTRDRFRTEALRVEDEITSSSDRLEQSIARMDGVTSTAFMQIGGMTEKFAEHGRLLSDAARLLDETQTNLQATLEERHEGLTLLAGTLADRSRDISTTLNSFEGCRGSPVSPRPRLGLAPWPRPSTASSAPASAKAEQQLEETERRSQAAAEQIREALRSVIEEASEKFRGGDGRYAPRRRDMRRELETARTEIRRGVFELPEETRESTRGHASRGVDQIRALRELSDIVSTSGRALDVRKPSTEDRGTRAAPAAEVERRAASPAAAETLPTTYARQCRSVADACIPADSRFGPACPVTASSRRFVRPLPAPAIWRSPRRPTRPLVRRRVMAMADGCPTSCVALRRMRTMHPRRR